MVKFKTFTYISVLMNIQNRLSGTSLLVFFMVLLLFLPINMQLSELNAVEVTNSTITLGPPLYNESYRIDSREEMTVNGTRATEVAFSGNGTLNGTNVTSIGKALVLPRPDGVSYLEGKASFMTADNGGKASYTFQALGNYGAAFFDSNATGSLSFLNNMVGIYKVETSESGNIFTMWNWGNNTKT